MATTQNTFTGNGSTTTFAFTFPYIEESDVKVALDTVDQTTGFSVDTTNIVFDTAPASGVAIRIYRVTNVDQAAATFFSGSAIRAQDLNDNVNQNLYVNQELSNRTALTTGSTITGDYIFANANIQFEGATDDDHETTLTVTDPTADRTIKLPNQSGTVPVLAADSNTAITATPEELNILDGVTATAAELNTMDGITATTAELNIMDGVTATTAELNLMDGVTATTGELNILDGVTATTGELNLMDGVTATTAELNYVDGVTSAIQTQLDAKQPLDAELTELATMGSNTAAALADLTQAEVQILDGATLSTAELNFVDGVTSDIQTQIDGKQAADAELTELATMGSTTASALADLTQAEVEVLDGATVTTAELNILDGVTASTAELNLLDGVTATTAELNILDGVTATFTELNQLDGNTLKTTSTDFTSSSQFPSASEIDSRITARIDPIDGFVAIADEDSFPTTTPPVGTAVSISNAGGMVIGASASTTDASRAGVSDTVTIQNIPANMQSQTIQDGIGMIVIATSTAHTYDFHRVIATNADVIALSDDINDFNNRYRVGSTNPTVDNDEGDLFYNTGSDKMLVYDGSSWEEVQSIGEYFIIPDSDFPTWNGTLNDISITSNAPANAEQIILSINGVIQEPNSGTARPTDGFSLNGSTIQLSAAPATGSEAWGVIIGSTVNIGTPSAGTVTNTQVSASAAIAGSKIDPDFGSQNIVTTGNVGIGTSSPASLLHLKSDTPYIRFEDDNDNQDWQIEARSFFGISDVTNSAFRFVIDSSGNLGIGTSSPSASIHLAVSDPQVRLQRTGAYSTSSGPLIQFQGKGPNSTNYNFGKIQAVSSGSNNAGELQFFTNNAGSQSERMRIDSSGFVGINNSSPSTFSQVNARNLVIGNGSGDKGLTIFSGTTGVGRIAFADGTAASNVQYRGLFGYDHTNDRMFFGTGGTNNRMVIDSSGRLLIGATSSNSSIAGFSGAGLQQNSTNTALTCINLIHRQNGSNTHALVFARARDGGANGGRVTTGQTLGVVSFQGFGGTGGATYRQAAEIRGVVDGGPDGNTMPGRLEFYTANTGSPSSLIERMRIKNDGNVELLDGNLIVANGHGIDFSATGNSNGTMSSELLDDYEEGTWTPGLQFSSNQAGSFTYSGNNGARYTKIGRVVHINGILEWTNHSITAGSALQLTGLPFPTATGNAARAGISIAYSSVPFTGLTIYQHAMRSESSADFMTVNYANATDGSIDNQINYSNVRTNGAFIFFGMYIV